MQYAFIRNFQSGEMVGRVYLDSFPTSILYNPKNENLVIGHDGIFFYQQILNPFLDGYLSIVRFKKNSTERYKSYLDGQIYQIIQSKKSRNLILFHDAGFCSYKY